MMRTPTLSAIYAAEMRIVQAKQQTRVSLQQARNVFRSKLSRPSTLILITAATGLTAFLAFRRSKSRPPEHTKTGSFAGVVLAFIVRYSMQRLPLIAEKFQRIYQKRAAQNTPESATTSGMPAQTPHQ